ncbi:O-succinylbenzoate synthase [Propionibacterium australiense]|uniref:o-succinylbenzoate synthase n=1 Tax=Propionibacterium australiense TaxID=119981 RepID=A0A8B3FK01_9ACTN|nr:o-succinylbenzoate synthase [Propionibacterium australiense]RLP07018.1 O-succinylbenzoate synthase [Propionibacterium australiense]RLP10833.1 O-succinylbenzoate synthase [Propionibacterium australiense]
MGRMQLGRLRVPGRLARAGIDEVLVFRVPLRHRFRRIDVRDGLLLHGPHGWGECSPFWDYDSAESAAWLRAGLEAATMPLPAPLRETIPVNVTIPVVGPQDAARLVAASGGCTTAKVKVADPRSTLADDCARVEAVRQALGPGGRIRVDANAAWTVDEAVAALTELDDAAGGLEYAEQPCRSVEELARVRARVDVPIAADESVRRAEDPLAVARAGAADVLVIKAQPLGGVRRALDVVARSGLDAVVSSALDTSVGISVAAHLAASLPTLDHACGLATVELFDGDVTDHPILPTCGAIPVTRATVEAPVGDAAALPGGLADRWAERLDALCGELR